MKIQSLNVHMSHLITLFSKAIYTTSISHQPIFCRRGDISSFFLTKNGDPSSLHTVMADFKHFEIQLTQDTTTTITHMVMIKGLI